ncbi:tRNA(Ile)-lysidine synthetase [Acidipila sp. EB88]|nr:tRNA(Ile)-lysidine synthetase [Acidipila sp. EB88]
MALLHLAAGLAKKQGWLPQVVHVHHGLRGAAADEDAALVEQQARSLRLPCRVLRVDLARRARVLRVGLEQAGRLCRYDWFRRLMELGELDAIATGHTMDDQAETVLLKLLRGSWTAGLAGIYPVLPAADLPRLDEPQLGAPELSRSVAAASGGSAILPPAHVPQRSRPPGVLVRPLLGARRSALQEWLRAEGLPWRDDASNDELVFTRNRIRHQLLPSLMEYNPNMTEQLAQTSALARDEETYWQAEVDRVLPGLLLPGRPVRGGGRSSSTLPGEQSLAIEVERLRVLAPALVRRLVRAAAARLGGSLDFAETERVLALLQGAVGSVPRREQLGASLRAERSPRELRFVRAEPKALGTVEDVLVSVPGDVQALGIQLKVELAAGTAVAATGALPQATLRGTRPADRVTQRYSRGTPRRIKEVLERMGVPSEARAGWPVLVWQGEIVWVRGAVLEPTPLSTQLHVTWQEG